MDSAAPAAAPTGQRLLVHPTDADVFGLTFLMPRQAMIDADQAADVVYAVEAAGHRAADGLITGIWSNGSGSSRCRGTTDTFIGHGLTSAWASSRTSVPAAYDGTK